MTGIPTTTTSPSGATSAPGPSSSTTTAAQEALELAEACNLLYLRIFEGLDILEKHNQHWPITLLCATAIDALATGTSKSAKSTGQNYKNFMKRCPALKDYAPFADRFYATIRSGLVHSLMPKTHPSYKHGPAAIGDGNAPPRISSEAANPGRDHLIVDAPHLLASTRTMFNDFKNGRFMGRFKQIVYDETSAGLVPKP